MKAVFYDDSSKLCGKRGLPEPSEGLKTIWGQAGLFRKQGFTLKLPKLKRNTLNSEPPIPPLPLPWMPLISFWLLRRRIEGQTTMERPDIQHKRPLQIYKDDPQF